MMYRFTIIFLFFVDSLAHIAHGSFFGAINRADTTQALKFLKHKPSLATFIDKGGRTALIVAAQNNDVELVSVLLSKYGAKAVINATETQSGNSALIYAAARGLFEVALLLVHNGADVNLLTEFGVTPLMYASAERGRIDTISLLLTNGARINAQDCHGETPLMYAITGRREDIVLYLVQQGADRTLQNKQYMTALNLAEKYHREALGWLDQSLIKKFEVMIDILKQS